tara:strand:+ start:77 stop:202 length:126 start_codon:yes stop_codon:yes gene_type:complete
VEVVDQIHLLVLEEAEVVLVELEVIDQVVQEVLVELVELTL